MPRDRLKGTTPDLFADGYAVSKPPSRTPASASSAEPHAGRQVVLPEDLSGALRHLDDGQLDRLLREVITEARRRGRLPPELQSDTKAHRQKKERKAASPRAKAAPVRPVDVPAGQANLIRAAFKAGVKPAAIAREFRISRSVVSQVLAAPGKPVR